QAAQAELAEPIAEPVAPFADSGPVPLADAPVLAEGPVPVESAAVHPADVHDAPAAGPTADEVGPMDAAPPAWPVEPAAAEALAAAAPVTADPLDEITAPAATATEPQPAAEAAAIAEPSFGEAHGPQPA